MDPQQVLTRLNFGRVDGETDNRFENCFIGTEMLRQVLMPQHSLVVGNKGSGKSAMCRLLCDDLQKVRPLLPKNFEEIYCIPAYGLQSEEYLPTGDLLELKPTTVDDFRYFWLLYLGLKTAYTLVQDEKMKTLIAKKKSEKVQKAFATLQQILTDVGLIERSGLFTKMRKSLGMRKKPAGRPREDSEGKSFSLNFKEKTGLSIMALMENVEVLLQETNCLAWLMLDKLDLLFVEDIEKLRSAITGLIQLLVQYGSQFKNIHFKIFLRNDIFRQLHIVNKSHLVSYSTEMRWRGPLLLKLLVARAVVDPFVREYCEEVCGEKSDVSAIILGSDDFVKKIFFTIFEPTMSNGASSDNAPPTDEWILKRLMDGMGNSFPRELIHLGNKAVERQREIDRLEGDHTSTHLISPRALREAFEGISTYRCDTYLYSEFPHLKQHFDVFRGSDSTMFHREELYMLFQPLSPNGDEAIRALYDTGLLTPLGKNLDSSKKFRVPLLYKIGLGMTDHRSRSRPSQSKTNEDRPRNGEREHIDSEEHIDGHEMN
ncbi:MAG TPA: hypothetical protein VES59_09195 [Bacteroidota bacterium]|nr:hypothetical protein [Bacteroidota bacterium]